MRIPLFLGHCIIRDGLANRDTVEFTGVPLHNMLFAAPIIEIIMKRMIKLLSKLWKDNVE